MVEAFYAAHVDCHVPKTRVREKIAEIATYDKISRAWVINQTSSILKEARGPAGGGMSKEAVDWCQTISTVLGGEYDHHSVVSLLVLAGEAL